MFELDWGKLVIIGIVALIAIGPKELPTVLRTLGQWMGKIRRMAAEFQGQFQEALREAEMADLKKQADDLRSSVTDFTNFDPLADSPKPSGEAGASEPVTLAAPANEASPPEQPAPVSDQDLAPAEPPSKQAGSGA
jgi:sec-independent protein translocase protein TatB